MARADRDIGIGFALLREFQDYSDQGELDIPDSDMCIGRIYIDKQMVLNTAVMNYAFVFITNSTNSKTLFLNSQSTYWIIIESFSRGEPRRYNTYKVPFFSREKPLLLFP